MMGNEILVLSSNGGPEIYHVPALEKMGFKAFFSGRGGGSSAPPFDSLNVSLDVGDNPAAVNENTARIFKAENLTRVWRARQVHGDHVLATDQWPTIRLEDADALVVAAPDVAACVSVADCLPALLADPVSRVAAAVHAGRKGTELHIIRKTLQRMSSWFGSKPENVVAVFGPCIRPCCYEVDQNSADRFHQCCGGSGRMLDIAKANRDQLTSGGVRASNIYDCGICTSCSHQSFFSHRSGKGATGRFLAGISITSR